MDIMKLAFLNRLSRCLIFSCFLGQPVAAQPVSSAAFADTNYWKAFDWTNAADTDVWRMPQWGPLIANIKEPAWAETRTQPILLDKQPMDLVSVVDRSAATTKYRFQIRSNGYEKLCKTVFEWATSHFGTGVSKVRTADMGFVTPTLFVTEEHQWDLGETRVTLNCLGLSEQAEPKPNISVILDYRAVAAMPKLLPLTSINCISDGSSRDMILILDEADPAVLNSELAPIGSEVSFSPTMVRWSRVIQGATVSYELNRLSGRLAALIEGGPPGIPLADRTIRWACEKVDLAAPKF